METHQIQDAEMLRLRLNIESGIKEIMAYYDFNRVCRVMKCLEWEWLFLTSNSRIPSLLDIKEEVMRQFDSLTEEIIRDGGKYYQYKVETGGFLYTIVYNRNPVSVHVSLSFSVESWDVDVTLVKAQRNT